MAAAWKARMALQCLSDQARQALYPDRTDGVLEENSVEMSLLEKMLEKGHEALGSDIAINTGSQSGAKRIEAMFEKVSFAREMQVEGRPADVGVANNVIHRHRYISLREHKFAEY
jgi:hypothetical protein